MKVLVCGGRAYRDGDKVHAVLTGLHTETPITAVIQGSARGADYYASKWAQAAKVRLLNFRPNWEKYGKAAGPIRNQQMLDEARPDLVLAFPGGAGTFDMVQRARAAGVSIREID